MRLDAVFSEGEWLFLVETPKRVSDWTTYHCRYCRLNFRVPGEGVARYCTICGGPHPERIGHFPSPFRGLYMRSCGK